MTDRLTTLTTQIARLPGRTPATVVAEAADVSRPSKSRNDRAPIGAATFGPSGWGIVAEPVDGPSKGQDAYGGWLVRCSIRPPETDAERDAIASAMARRWRDETRHIHALAADDSRLDDERGSERALKTDIEQTLREVQL